MPPSTGNATPTAGPPSLNHHQHLNLSTATSHAGDVQAAPPVLHPSPSPSPSPSTGFPWTTDSASFSDEQAPMSDPLESQQPHSPLDPDGLRLAFQRPSAARSPGEAKTPLKTPPVPGAWKASPKLVAQPALPSPSLAFAVEQVDRRDHADKAKKSVVITTSESQLQLNQYREQLARNLERREMSARAVVSNPNDKARVSPIQEEAPSVAPQTSSGPATASTESANTVRGWATPGIGIAGTPSYPFPRMVTPGYMPSSLHRPFTALSPTQPLSSHNAPPSDKYAAHDRVLSNTSTPGSVMTFQPSGPMPRSDNPDFPSPNLYDLALMLTSEPGMEAWWNTVVQLMRDTFKAERVTLAVPADTTDIENVPWGQKATYNEHHEDEGSMGYLARGSSLVPSSTDDVSSATSNTPSNADDTIRPKFSTRPSLLSRHSYTSYENKIEKNAPGLARRPTNLARSKSYLPPSQTPGEHPSGDLSHPISSSLYSSTLEAHDATEEQQAIPAWEAPLIPRTKSPGRVLPVLQALDYEADPLIDHGGVRRVLDRGEVVALTRTYPYLQSSLADQPSKSKLKKGKDDAKKRSRKFGAENASKLSSLLASANVPRAQPADKTRQAASMMSRLEEDIPRPPTPKYEEYEQPLPSPWSQSPAPSPAIRSDPKDDPFFTEAVVDEESFNPGSAPPDYIGIKPPEAIGVDNSWTVLHIPLSHVLHYRPAQPFKLDATALEQKSHARKASTTEAPEGATASSPMPSEKREKNLAPPIAILSILSPLIPYPSNLRRSLAHLAPHLTTSFSLARQYTHLETELAGLRRRRPETAGFGAIDVAGRPLEALPSIANLDFLPPGEVAQQRSLAGSLTSPSEYSGISKSANASPLGTPGWEGALGVSIDKRQAVTSPGQISSDGYFNTKQKPKMVRADTSTASSQKSWRSSKDSSPADKRLSRLATLLLPDQGGQYRESVEGDMSGETTEKVSSDATGLSGYQRQAGPVESPRDSLRDSKEEWMGDRTHHPLTDVLTASAEPGNSGNIQRRHTLLHSYGADFATSFQSLPASSTIASKGTGASIPPARSGSVSAGTVDMPPPSDRLKGLILDSLPAHVFVALPQNGEIVWVNSRYLTYRGQTVADLTTDTWSSIHPDDRDEYLKAWGHSLRTGEQFSRTVRIKRFDGQYRWFYARAVASRDKRGVIMQFLGSYMDIHDQHIAELKAARQEEIEASEAKHRLLANLIPQIIFTATEHEGITFANEQWLSYTGQSFEDSLGLGFIDYVHPEDLAKCRIPVDRPPTPLTSRSRPDNKSAVEINPSENTMTETLRPAHGASESVLKGMHQALSRHNSSSSESVYEMPMADLNELAKKGIVKVARDSNGRLSYTTEVRLRSKSGEYRWHLVRCVEIDNINLGSGASSYFGSATDINDHKLLEAKLKEAMESKSRFLSNMSHEIRTPLIGISGMVSFLQDTKLNDEQRDYTNTIQTSANSLLMIINDILDLSKVDAGMMKLKYEWFHIRSLIEDVNELVSTMAIAKRLELNYIVEEAVPAWIKGDKVRIRQVLLNVIGNAIKFTTEGEVFSRCTVYTAQDTAQTDDKIMLEFAIIDTGRGFTKEEADLIFKPFSQIDGSSTRQHGGSGLGLVISRQLVELHGGTMQGTAVPGKGSTFTFTAEFGLPTVSDHPDLPTSPRSPSATTKQQTETVDVRSIFKPVINSAILHRSSPKMSPGTDAEFVSPPVAASSGSSNPSVRSGVSRDTDRSSISSANMSFVSFSQAARAAGQDLSQMKLAMPPSRSSPGSTPTADDPKAVITPPDFRPPLYSILIICPQTHSREATTQHIEMTLPKEVPYQITAKATVEEAQTLIGGDDPVIFTHIVINLPSAEEIIALMDQITRSIKGNNTMILILSDSVQRQAVAKLAASSKCEELFSESRVTFIYKPVKPSRFAVIFDPDKVRDLSIDRNRSTAARMVETQKASYLEIERRMGNKGHRVLLVEDNPVNQKVLQKYLRKVGVGVDVAMDGVECTNMVFSHEHDYWSLILCDLHMPRKDGYQACREIRQWEQEHGLERMPIIALSANVMSDVQEKCIAAGFNDYVTKPVDFIDLSRAMAKFF